MNNFKLGRPNLAIAVENSQHFAAPPMVYSWNDVWETNAEIPYWWHITSQIWVRAFHWLKICFIQSEALSRSGWWRIISIEFLCSFLRCHFVGKPVGGSRNVCCFPMLIANLAILTKNKKKRKTLISIYAIFAISCHNLCLFNCGTHTRIHLSNKFVDQFNIYWYHMTKNILPFYFND